VVIAPGHLRAMPVLIEYTGYRENITFRMKYLKRKEIRVIGHGSVFSLDDDDEHERLVSENPGCFRYVPDTSKCEVCGGEFASGQAMNRHKREVHPELKRPEGPMTRQNKTAWYKKRLSEIKMPDHRRR
jgi:hypothetical protein